MEKQLKIGLLGFGAMGKVHSYCIDGLKYYYSDTEFDAKIYLKDINTSCDFELFKYLTQDTDYQFTNEAYNLHSTAKKMIIL